MTSSFLWPFCVTISFNAYSNSSAFCLPIGFKNQTFYPPSPKFINSNNINFLLTSIHSSLHVCIFFLNPEKFWTDGKWSSLMQSSGSAFSRFDKVSSNSSFSLCWFFTTIWLHLFFNICGNTQNSFQIALRLTIGLLRCLTSHDNWLHIDCNDQYNISSLNTISQLPYSNRW